MSPTIWKIFKAGLYAITVLVVGSAGMVVGHLIQGSAASGPTVADSMLETRLEVGDRFPDVTLVDTAGDSSTTSALLESGGIVLFLDLDCDPCSEMTARWQRAIEDHLVENEWIIGVTYRLPERIEQYRAEHGITFRVLHDPAAVFRSNYNVQLVPLEVVIGASGRIRSSSRDRNSPIDIDAILAQLVE